jgi:hypothetical protein
MFARSVGIGASPSPLLKAACLFGMNGLAVSGMLLTVLGPVAWGDPGADRLDQGWRVGEGLKQGLNLLPMALRRKPRCISSGLMITGIRSWMAATAA